MDEKKIPEQWGTQTNMEAGNLEEILELPQELMAGNEELAFSVMAKTKQIINGVVYYKELMMMYTCAIKEIRTKFDVLNTEFNVRYQRNPINFINTRIKISSSII